MIFEYLERLPVHARISQDATIASDQRDAAVNRPRESVRFLSVGYDRFYCQYGLVGFISMDLSLKDLERSVRMASDSKLEIADIYSIPASPLDRAMNELFNLTRRSELIWPPFPLATVLLALRFLNPAAYDRVDKSLDENPKQFGSAIPYNFLVPYFPPLTGH